MIKVILETKRLILREYNKDDFKELYEILSDPITMSHYPKPYDEEGTMRWINWCINSYKENGFGLCAIILKETNTFIGDCGISMQKLMASGYLRLDIISIKSIGVTDMQKKREWLLLNGLL